MRMPKAATRWATEKAMPRLQSGDACGRHIDPRSRGAATVGAKGQRRQHAGLVAVGRIWR
jgi:hypothetical protein